MPGVSKEQILFTMVDARTNFANMIISGKPRAGKTALLNYLLSIVAKSRDVRIGTIEEGSRELTLRRFNESGRPANQVLPRPLSALSAPRR